MVPPHTKVAAKPVLPKHFNQHPNHNLNQPKDQSKYNQPKDGKNKHQTYLNKQKNAYANLPTNWWLVFKDPQLSKLMQMALVKNADIATAAIRLKKAQLQIQTANNALYPKYSMGVSASARKILPFNQQNPVDTKITQSYGASLGASYEVDLWGKLALTKDIATWQTIASAEDLRAVKLAQTTQIAQQYWQIGYLNAQIAFVKDNIRHTEETLRIVKVRYKAGAVARMDLVSAQNSLLNVRMQLQPLLDSRQQARNTLAILLNRPPSTIPLFTELQTLPDIDIKLIPTNIPSQVLYQRPDIAAAEWRLRSTLANVDIARTAFYPSLSINANVGMGGSKLLDILKNPVGSVALSPLLPFLNHKQNTLAHASSQLDYQQAVINFRKQLYSALGEVENALASQRSLATKQQQLEQSLRYAKQLQRMHKVRYLSGADDLQSWINAQQSYSQAQRALLDNQYAHYRSFISLFSALGGSPQTRAGHTLPVFK